MRNKLATLTTFLARRLTPSRARWLGLLVVLSLAGWLRLTNLSALPPAPYWEEVALGYDAYSILQTGHDHHGNFLPLVAFESFGDWKPAGYFYAIVPFIVALDLTVPAVRLPAALSGWLTVLGIGALAWQLSPYFFDRRLRQVATGAALLAAATSPWGIQFSRGGWEAMLATSLIVAAVGAWLQFTQLSLPEHRRHATTRRVTLWLVGSIILLGMAMYTYQAARLTVPLLAVGLVIGWWWRHQGQACPPSTFSRLKQFVSAQRQPLVVALIVTGLLSLPLVMAAGNPALTQRFAETSLFTRLEPIETSNAIKQAADKSLLSRLFAHRYLFFVRDVADQFLTHFRTDFLFLSGDANPRHSIQLFGQLLYTDALWVVLGLVVAIRSRGWAAFLVVWWLLVGIVPASLTKTAPHALRTLPTWPVWMLLVSLGMVYALQLVRQAVNRFPKKIVSTRAVTSAFIAVVIAGNVLQIGWWWRTYSLVYPKLHGREWQVGYRQMIIALEQLRADHPQLPIFITREQGRPAMFYWFYTRTDPREVQAAQATARLDQGEFTTFKQFTFVRSLDEVPPQPAVVAGSPQQWQALSQRLLAETVSPQPISIIVDTADVPVWTVGLISEPGT